MVNFTEKQKTDILMNYTQTINNIRMLNAVWEDALTDYEELPNDLKRMVKKHHTRQMLYYDTLKQIYMAVYSGNIENIDVMRTYLIKFSNGIIEDMVESEAYEENTYLKECDGLKHKLNMVDTWINAVK